MTRYSGLWLLVPMYLVSTPWQWDHTLEKNTVHFMADRKQRKTGQGQWGKIPLRTHTHSPAKCHLNFIEPLEIVLPTKDHPSTSWALLLKTTTKSPPSILAVSSPSHKGESYDPPCLYFQSLALRQACSRHSGIIGWTSARILRFYFTDNSPSTSQYSSNSSSVSPLW